jgi:hypothetical protein
MTDRRKLGAITPIGGRRFPRRLGAPGHRRHPRLRPSYFFWASSRDCWYCWMTFEASCCGISS